MTDRYYEEVKETVNQQIGLAFFLGVNSALTTAKVERTPELVQQIVELCKQVANGEFTFRPTDTELRMQGKEPTQSVKDFATNDKFLAEAALSWLRT